MNVWSSLTNKLMQNSCFKLFEKNSSKFTGYIVGLVYIVTYQYATVVFELIVLWQCEIFIYSY